MAGEKVTWYTKPTKAKTTAKLAPVKQAPIVANSFSPDTYADELLGYDRRELESDPKFKAQWEKFVQGGKGDRSDKVNFERHLSTFAHDKRVGEDPGFAQYSKTQRKAKGGLLGMIKRAPKAFGKGVLNMAESTAPVWGTAVLGGLATGGESLGMGVVGGGASATGATGLGASLHGTGAAIAPLGTAGAGAGAGAVASGLGASVHGTASAVAPLGTAGAANTLTTTVAPGIPFAGGGVPSVQPTMPTNPTGSGFSGTGPGVSGTAPGGGNWWDSITEGFGGWGNMVATGMDAYGSYQQGKQSQEDYQKAFDTANPFAKHRAGYADRLNKLYEDPSSVENLPGYQFQMEQGTKAIKRGAASKGQRLGGGVGFEYAKFGQGLASQMRQQEISNLSQLSGATMGFGGGQYGAGAGQQYWGGIQDATGTISHARGYRGYKNNAY